ncbi:hypothetical protein AB6Q56_14560 [Dechloromonas sp. ARDL1]|uniref:hypothetical protein n=1 Tax=Dechloromonas sp. ARDL1 TaxID=3322121 RepID=UPI003DA6D0FB
MKKSKQIMEVALSTPEAADLTSKAAQAGMPTAEFLGIQVLAGAYGSQHPEVKAFQKRVRLGINGPETQKPQEDVQ